MNCVISNANVKRFGRSFHALGKLGDVVYVDINSDCFLLHTVNSSRSAYGSFKFFPTFFSAFKFESQSNCKVAIKSCFVVFKSLMTIEKNTDRCCFEFLADSDSLRIKLFCKHDIVKTYTLPFIECEALKTSFRVNQNSNILCAQSRLLIDSVQNFQSSVEEVTLKVSQDKISLKNYTEEEKDPTKVVHTEVAYEIEEFESHKFENNAEITFCLKEFKAILSYVEGSNTPVSIRFEEPGKPIVFSVENFFEMEITFILATLADHPSPPCTNSGNSVSDKIKPVNRKNNNGKESAFNTSQVSTKTCTTLQTDSEVCEAANLNVFMIDLTRDENERTEEPVNEAANKNPVSVASTLVESEKCATSQDELDDDENDILMNMPMEDDVIPSTPPKKRFRENFLGLLNLSQYTSMIAQPDPILVKDSDEDDDE